MSFLRCLGLGLALLTLSASARAQYGPNSTCATARVLVEGSYEWLDLEDVYEPWHNLDAFNEDFYRITLQPGDRLRLTDTITSSSGPPSTMYGELTEGCPGFGVPLLGAITNGGVITVENATAAPRTLIYNTWAWVNDTGHIDLTYTLDVDFAPAACPNAVDDDLEPIGAALSRPIGFGTRSNLFARYFDDDLYSLQLPLGTTIHVTANLQNALGDLDLTVYDDIASVSSSTTTDQESVTFTNSIGPDPVRTTYIRVAPKPGAVGVCNTYALTVDVVATAIGTSHCATNPNGFGMEARLLPGGSSSVTANDLRFWCQAFPGANPGVLFAGTTQTSVPFGDGFLCTGGNVVRLRQSSAQNAVAVYAPDFSTTPGSLITPGTTRHYQVLYRDQTLPGGAGFNLTNAVAIAMTP